jgi:lysophospholipase L1-like esterase
MGRQGRVRAAALLAAGSVLGVLAAGCATDSAGNWRLAWRSETVFSNTTDTAQTCRLAARLAGNGTRLRVEFTSPLGDRGFRVEGATVGRAVAARSMDEVPSTQRTVTFAGHGSVRIGPHKRVWSDPVDLPVQAGDTVIVTLTVGPGDAATKAAQTDPFGCATGVVPLDSPGDLFSRVNGEAWVRSILLDGARLRSVVGVGDSLTENSLFALPAAYQRWTDVLLARGVAAVNAAASGGQLTGVGLWGSITGLARVRSVLDEPNVDDLVLALGTNDLGDRVTAATLLDAVRHVISLAHDAGVRLWVVTVPPRADPIWSAADERERQAFNATLRGSFLERNGVGLVDLDAALRDPAAPGKLLARYDGGDHLHMNAAGEVAFADAVARALGLPMS